MNEELDACDEAGAASIDPALDRRGVNVLTGDDSAAPFGGAAFRHARIRAPIGWRARRSLFARSAGL
ncbi:MAG: hypothetical protein ABR878_10935 [Roseiarcus sp.]|jgi:hypothetical protein